MNNQKSLFVVLSAWLIAGVCNAAVNPEFIANLKQKYPNTTFTSVRESEIAGLYEVVMGKNIAYTDSSARYFLFGNVFDMQEQRDLTSVKKESIQTTVSFPKDQLGQAFKRVKGNGSRVVALFSDPDCPYCKKIESELDQLNDVTIYTFMYPLVSIHPNAKTKAEAIWCASDKAASWNAWMKQATLTASNSCANPIDDNLKLGERLGISGTPTMISADGRKLSGAVSADRINTWLNESKTVAKQ